MPKLVIMLRVKDGLMFVHDWLNCFEHLVDEIVVLDNSSTDGTFEILKRHPKVTDIVQTQGYNEGRDKNMLYAMARKRNPDWLMWLDVDEIFEPELTRAHFNKLMARKYVNQFKFRRYHFIDKDHFAGSGTYFYYTCIHDRVMWRESPKGYFENFILDSPNVKGITGVSVNTNFRLKHLGYISKEIVDSKAALYLTVDPTKGTTVQGMYLHNEKKIRWHDNRNSIAVKSLNTFLSLRQFVSLFPRGYHKLAGMIGRQQVSLSK